MGKNIKKEDMGLACGTETSKQKRKLLNLIQGIRKFLITVPEHQISEYFKTQASKFLITVPKLQNPSKQKRKLDQIREVDLSLCV